MATKDNNLLLFEDKENNVTENGQYNNFTLNKNLLCSSRRSTSVITERKVLDYDFTNASQTKKESHSWNKSTTNLSLNFANNGFGKEDKLKKRKPINASTLSLYIKAYENSNDDYLCGVTKEDLKKNDLIKKGLNAKQINFDLTAVIQNPFEFSRQQEYTEVIPPEITHFTASQQLLNPNLQPQQAHVPIQTIQQSINPVQASPSTKRKSMSILEKSEIVKRWKAGYLETKPAVKGGYVQVLENGKVTGHICVYCERYFIGSIIGSTQRNHECIKKTPVFSASQKQNAKKSSLKMVKVDLLPFSVVNKPGLLDFAKTMIEIGSDLSPQEAKNLTINDVKSLLPHPTTLSNHVNSLNTKKPQLYAILKRKSNDSGISIMIDGTSKKYHYTGIHISFIDENWTFHSLLTNLITGHGKGESTAVYVTQETLKFLEDFGIDISLINAFVTDEAAAMLAAFRHTERLIICACHMLSTICKHALVLYAKDRAEQPQLHQSLQVVCDFKKKLKDVVTVIRSKIHVNKVISHPLYQSNETRFLSFTTSLDSFLTLTEEDHKIIDAELAGHTVYANYLELIEAKNDLKTIYNVLYPTISVLRSLEVGTQPTLHLVVPCFARLYRQFENIEDWSDEIEYSMKTAALLALKEKIPNITDFHYFSTILDPNAKWDIMSFLLPDRNGQTRVVTELIEKLRVAVKMYVVRTRRYRPRVNVPAEDDNPYSAAITSSQVDTAEMVVDNEINKYLADKETYSISILGYWKKSSAHYPYLSSFAKYLLSIPASSCPLERSFSVLNKVDCKERPQLSQETISNIVLSNAMEKYFPAISASL